jgi:hypothetical protein
VLELAPTHLRRCSPTSNRNTFSINANFISLLEQYRLHTDALLRGSRDHEGALALIGRIEGRLDGLYEWRKKRGESHGTVSPHIAAGRLANSDRGRNSNND